MIENNSLKEIAKTLSANEQNALVKEVGRNMTFDVPRTIAIVLDAASHGIAVGTATYSTKKSALVYNVGGQTK